MHKWKTLIILLFIIPLFGAANAQEMVNQQHKATRYHNKFVNRKTSSGERFSQNKYTAAHKNIKLGTYVLVVDTVTKKWVVVKVNDRCVGSNVIDLAGIAAERIGITKRKGVSRVLVTILGDEGEALWMRQDSMPADYTAQIINSLPKAAEPPQQPIIAENTKKTDKDTPAKNTAKVSDNRKASPEVPKKHSPVKIYISNIENTDVAEDLLEEMQPSVTQNARIINNTEEIKIELILTDNIDKFLNNFKNKHPQYALTIIDTEQK